MATLTVGTIVRTGTATALVAAAGGGDQFANDGNTYFEVNNGGGSPITVAFVVQRTVDGLAVTNPGGSVTNGTRKRFGPFKTGIFNNANDRVEVTYSDVTSVTVEAVKLPDP